MKQATYTVLAALLVLVLSSQVLAPDTLVTDSVSGSKTLIYTFAIKDNIAAPTWRITQEAIEEAIALEADVVILSDYGKGTLHAIEQFISAAKEANIPVLIDPKGNDFSIYRGATLITPNWNEFEAVVGPCRSDDELVEKGQKLLADLDLSALLVTRGEKGMTLLSQQAAPLHLPTQAREVFDVTGAGDTVISVLATALAARKPLAEATALANLAAGIVVGKLGTATASRDELEQAIQGERAEYHGVLSLSQAQEVLKHARQRQEKIVATNGCFDILHPGHIHYLRQARALGERLIILVNSDDSVRRLKGPERPINRLEHRMEMLSALECVDWVIPFNGDTPEELLCQLLPDILVKGGDYPDPTQIAGHDCVVANGGEVQILQFVEGCSTTNIIETIRNSTR